MAMPRPRVKLDAAPVPFPVRTVTLFVPSLFWPETGDADPFESLRLPALEILLNRGSAADCACEDEPAWFCGRFGVQKQIDWPVAPLALAGDGGTPGTDYWLRADPVHLRAHNDGLILLAPETLDITEQESRELTAALNGQFATEGLGLHAAHPRRWYLKMPQAPKIHTVALKQAVGRDVNYLLPEGEERLRWHRIFNTVQMLLHSHPVNTARTNRGMAEVNSLWFWGGGTLPAASSPFDVLHSDDPLALGLGRLAGVIVAPLPVGGDSTAGNNTLAELGDAQLEYMRGNIAGWRERLESLETRWFARILERLRSGEIGKIVIATVADGRAREWSVWRGALWRIWKRPLPLAHHARAISHRRDRPRLA